MVGRVARVLSIAGSDSGGGAGIQADIKTCAALEVYCSTVVTAVTAQNTAEVRGTHPVPAEFVGLQVDAVLTDIGADAVKTGMLSEAGIVEVVARKLREHGVGNVVVDPVMISQSGHPLMSREAVGALTSHLIPLATVVTPNVREAEELSGVKISCPADMRRAAEQIVSLGASNVLVTGGHMPGAPIDLLYGAAGEMSFEGERVAGGPVHGAGCSFSAAIAASLAKGMTVVEAVREAKELVAGAIRCAVAVGHGLRPVDVVGAARRPAARWAVLGELDEALRLLQEAEVGHLIPEVQSNLGMALTDARGPQDVAAFPGRIVRLGKGVATASGPRFGASRHVAKIILTAMKHDPAKRSVMNIRYDPGTVETCRRLGLRLGSFDRADEPPDVQAIEGSSLEWGTEEAIRAAGGVPDVIHDGVGVGKEPMIRVLGASATDVVRKVLRIAAG